jgi:hypothetical protein
MVWGVKWGDSGGETSLCLVKRNMAGKCQIKIEGVKNEIARWGSNSA